VFETTDYEDTSVVLSRSMWHAKAGNDTVGTHPEIRDYLEEVQATIMSPDLVFQSTRDARSQVFYRLRAGRGVFTGKHLVVIVKYAQQPDSRRGYVRTVYLSRAGPRSAVMAENGERPPLIAVQYDDQADILTFTFTAVPQPAVAEEAADEVWVRYDPKTRRVITVDVLNFSARVHAAFGPTLTYTERTDPERLQALHGLPLPAREEET
jgi:uncharacterized protein YuzE